MEDMNTKMLMETFNFEDFQKQSETLSKMGSLGKIASMIPGMGGGLDPEKLADAEIRLRKHGAMIQSMKKKERLDPDLLIKDAGAGVRLARIARGSGTSIEQVESFLEEFVKMRGLMKKMARISNGDDTEEDVMANMGNRQQRRMAKKQKKKRGGGGGFWVG